MATRCLDDATFGDEWREWHDRHERERSRPLGFLAITGMHWLGPTPERFGDVPGAWSSDASGVHVALSEDEELLLDDSVLHGVHNFGRLSDGNHIAANFADNMVEITTRDGLNLIRPRHPDSEIRLNYAGTRAYPALREWRVSARFVADAILQSVRVDVMTEGLHHDFLSPGRAEFELRGKPYALTLFASADDELFVLFSDETAGVTTYGACRTLEVDPPDEEGIVILDFNRATNLPCAYTVFTICPLPPPENRLAVAIEAGEQLPYDASH